MIIYDYLFIQLAGKKISIAFALVTWKRLNTETTQHRNGSKIIFEAFFIFFKNMRKQTKNLRKLINKLRFLKFLKKAEPDQKYEETDQKSEETVPNMRKQINFKGLEKSGNISKI